MKNDRLLSKVRGALFGVCVGDALGLPVQFLSREEVRKSPVTGMRGYGTFGLPPGTWSDDSSLTLCLAESLCEGYDLDDIAGRFLRWYKDGYWTPSGQAFDIGNSTARAMRRLQNGATPRDSGDTDVFSNGNGSLMRSIPIAFYTASLRERKRFEIAHEVSAITHAHPRAMAACGIYNQVAVNMLDGADPEQAVEEAKKTMKRVYRRGPFAWELVHFSRILEGDISRFGEDDIGSDGYAVHTLEAALWCLLNEDSYESTALRAVNLGWDTDTTGAVAGGLAGLYHGFESIPAKWIDALARKDDILDLTDRFGEDVG
ncbi:MAG: ADP-ribosylglycohydrolase family protein [Spirochaetes bacterium]|nr:ADP-ribosylglycohydrolase family protein [Spirochaetota bacterium]